MKWLPDYFNDLGFAVTFLGFAFTIWQVWGIKGQIRRVIKKVNNNAHISDLSKAESTIVEIKRDVRENNLYEVDKKVAQIMAELITCRSICDDQQEIIENLIKTVATQQNWINKSLLNSANKGGFEELFNTLDEIRTIFAEALTKCKAKI